MEIGIYVAANIISRSRATFRRQSSLFLAAREASCHHTLRWTLFFKCTLASGRKCAAN